MAMALQQQATYLRGTTPPRRHISELPKSAAIALHYPPRKQTSSPLPEVKQHRIYDRGHVFSKSWNPERYICYETPPDVDSDASVPTQIDDYGLDPYKKFYHIIDMNTFVSQIILGKGSHMSVDMLAHSRYGNALPTSTAEGKPAGCLNVQQLAQQPFVVLILPTGWVKAIRNIPQNL
uniref:PPM-type phosphatase domain-containing protein n=1 Tax=Ascaris lumbricoides TaxID=6252 RepID=A0A0M3I2C5_ASCLU